MEGCNARSVDWCDCRFRDWAVCLSSVSWIVAQHLAALSYGSRDHAGDLHLVDNCRITDTNHREPAWKRSGGFVGAPDFYFGRCDRAGNLSHSREIDSRSDIAMRTNREKSKVRVAVVTLTAALMLTCLLYTSDAAD